MIQEMVQSELAGVIFTSDPVTGDFCTKMTLKKDLTLGETGRVTITSNWGLGESVVSGHVDPDTLVISSDTCQVINDHNIGLQN